MRRILRILQSWTGLRRSKPQGDSPWRLRLHPLLECRIRSVRVPLRRNRARFPEPEPEVPKAPPEFFHAAETEPAFPSRARFPERDIDTERERAASLCGDLVGSYAEGSRVPRAARRPRQGRFIMRQRDCGRAPRLGARGARRPAAEHAAPPCDVECGGLPFKNTSAIPGSPFAAGRNGWLHPTLPP